MFINVKYRPFGGKYLLVSLIRHIFEQFLKISSFLRNRPSRLVASCTNLFFLIFRHYNLYNDGILFV